MNLGNKKKGNNRGGLSLYYCLEGTQAKDTKFVYNDVKNITKESVELHNSYRSSSKSFGVSAGATVGYGHKLQMTGNGGSISVSRSNQNTVETIHANENFRNVNEVHNNTGTMTLSGFNQEGGKVTGNIEKVEVISRKNTSTTTGSSKGVNLGISANGVLSSVTINASRINGNRAFVDKQSTFVVGEGSSLTIGRVENTGAIIGKEGNSGLKIDEYTGKDIHNHDTMKTVGITAGTDGAGVNYENSVKEGITRNTVIGSPEIGRAEGAPINTDISKANETTREEHRKTNVFLEPQTIDYAMNPGKFKEDFEVAVLEGKATGEAILKTIENLVNGRKSSDMADPERRTLNEIKESIIRVKTAPQMESIAEAKDLNSPDVLKELGIAAIEKYDPYDPNLPIKVRQRVENTLEDGKIPGVFYDEITNKIFVYKGMEDDLEIRAGIAREWKISEDLKDGKGKPNEEGRVKATVAGELAYDDMMKRGREGKTGTISTDRFADAVMDEDSEVTSDDTTEEVRKFDEEYSQFMKKVDEARMKIISKKQEIGSDEFRNNLKMYSNKSPYPFTVVSPYFGYYYLESREQKKYFERITDIDGLSFTGLMIDKFDPSGYEKLKNSKEYTIGMLKANINSYESAEKHFKENGLELGTFTIANELTKQNFVSQDEIIKLKTRLGIGAIITNADGLNITLRNASIKSYIEINVSEGNKKGEKFVTITRYTRLGDKFEKPYDLVAGFPSNKELGNPYTLLSHYERHKIFDKGRYVVTGKTDKDIKKEIIESINVLRNNEILNIKKIDPWEYKDYLNYKQRRKKGNK